MCLVTKRLCYCVIFKMDVSNEEQVQYICSYCKWSINSQCADYAEHECFRNRNFNIENQFIVADENNYLYIETVTEETEEGPLIWAPNTKPTTQDNEATELLISLRSNDYFKKKFDDKRNVKLSLWKEIAKQVENSGYKLGPNGGVRCRAKFSNLQHRYTQFLQHMKGTGNCNLPKPPFFDEMHELLGTKAKAVPKFTIDSEECLNQTESLGDSEAGSSTTSHEGNTQRSFKRKFTHGEEKEAVVKRSKNNNDRIIQTIIKCNEEERDERKAQFNVLKELLEKQVEQRDRLLDILQNMNR